MPECQAYGCTNIQGKGKAKGMRFFVIPDGRKDPSKRELAQKWLQQIGLGTGHTVEKYDFGRHKLVCEEHFEKSCFEEDFRAKIMGTKPRKFLKPHAFPTIFVYRQLKGDGGRHRKRQFRREVCELLSELSPKRTAGLSSTTKIVDMDLDHLSSGDVDVKLESQPSTSTVTQVNYREGIKLGLWRTPPSMRSSPSFYCGQSSKESSPQESEYQQFPSPQESEFSNLMDNPLSPRPAVNEGSMEIGLGLLPEFYEDGGKEEVIQPSPSGLITKVQVQSEKIISPPGSHNIKQKEGQFIQVMPNADAAKENTREIQILRLEVLNQENALGGGLPEVSTGKDGVAIRICDGKTQGVSPTGAKGIGAKPLVPGLTSLNNTQSEHSRPITTLEMPPALKASSLTSSGQIAVKPGDLATRQKSQEGVRVMSLPGRYKTSTGVTPLSSAPPTTSGTNQQTLPMVSYPPPGTHFYITAKSTDPNLQGKVILIPHQVLAQASAQLKTKAGKGRGNSTITKPTATGGKPSFLSPSNVLIFPQGSIMPRLHPGSIVQIQQVSSLARGSTVQTLTTVKSSIQAKPNAQAVVTSVNAHPSVTKPSPGVIIQIQKTTSGQSVAKIIQTQSVVKETTFLGVSLLPEMKNQLARTPSGGVILSQRRVNQGEGTYTQVTGSIPKLKLSQENASNQVLSCINRTASSSASRVPSQTKLLPGQTIISQTAAISSRRLKNTKTVHLVQYRGKHYMADHGQSGSVPSSRNDQLMSSGDSVPRVKPNTTTFSAGLLSPQMDASKLSAHTTINDQTLLPLPGLTSIHEPGLTVTPSNIVTKIKIEPSEESEAALLKYLSVPAANTSLSIGHRRRDGNSTSTAIKPKVESTLFTKNREETSQELMPKLPVLFKIVVKEETLETGDNTAKNTQLQSTDLGKILQVSSKSSSQASEEGETFESFTVNVCKNHSPEFQTTEGDAKVEGDVKIEEQNKTLTSDKNTSDETFSLKSVVKEEIIGSADTKRVTARVVNVDLAVIGPDTILSDAHKSDSNVSHIASVSSLALPPVTSITQNAPLMSSPPAVGCESLSTVKSESVNPPADSENLPLIKIKEEPQNINEYDLAPSHASSTIFFATPTAGISPSPEHKPGVFGVPGLEDEMSQILSKKDRGMSLLGVKTMEDVMCAIVKQKPLVKKDRDIAQLPFCARSLEIFQSWPYGKRRAAEWQRALHVRMTVMFLIPRLMFLWNQDIWSTKEIMLWCRKYGYTPVVKVPTEKIKA